MKSKYLIVIAIHPEREENFYWGKKIQNEDSIGSLAVDIFYQKLEEVYELYSEEYDTWERYIKNKNLQDFINEYDFRWLVKTRDELGF